MTKCVILFQVRCLGRLPVLCAERSMLVVVCAVIWRADEVDQLALSHWSHVQLSGHQQLPRTHVAMHHFSGCQVPGLELRGDVADITEAFPTCFDGT